jgi:hypothetical protein
MDKATKIYTVLMRHFQGLFRHTGGFITGLRKLEICPLREVLK